MTHRIYDSIMLDLPTLETFIYLNALQPLAQASMHLLIDTPQGFAQPPTF